MTYLPPALPPGFVPSARYRRGRPASAAVSIVLLVLSALALFCATGLDLFLWVTAAGVDTPTPHAQAVAVSSTVIIGWIISTALWWTGLVFTVRAIRRARQSWTIPLALGILIGAVQVLSWIISAGFQS